MEIWIIALITVTVFALWAVWYLFRNPPKEEDLPPGGWM